MESPSLLPDSVDRAMLATPERMFDLCCGGSQYDNTYPGKSTAQVHNQMPDRGTPIRGEYIYHSRSTSQEPQSQMSSSPSCHSTGLSHGSSSHRRSASTGLSFHFSLGRRDSFSHGRSQQLVASQPAHANGHTLQTPVYTQELESYSS